jgi:hypothetical protein
MNVRTILVLGGVLPAALALAFVSPADGARPRPAPREADPTARTLVTEGINENPGWMVRVSVDHPDRIYRVGDEVVVSVESEKDGYLYLFNIDANNEVTCLFPNKFQSDNKIQAGQAVKVPTAGFRIRVDPAAIGKEVIKAVVTKDPVNELKLSDLTRGGPTLVPLEKFRRLLLELSTGNPNARGGVRAAREDLKRRSLEVYGDRARRWADHDIEITTVANQAAAPQGKRVALLVGISKYKDGSIRELGCSHKDAIRMKQVLEQTGRFDSIQLLTNSQATLAAVRAALDQIIASTRAGDTVLIYWSGHGGRCASQSPPDVEPDGFDAYLVPHDGSLASDDEVRRTMLLDKTFGRWVQELDGRRVMVVLDTCHSGGQIASARDPRRRLEFNHDGTPRFARGIVYRGPRADAPWNKPHFLATEIVRARRIGQRDAAVLAACTQRQFAFERKEQDLGVMTYFLVEGITKGPAHLTLKDLYEQYVQRQVAEYVDREFPGSPQNPVFSDQTPRPAAEIRP